MQTLFKKLLIIGLVLASTGCLHKLPVDLKLPGEFSQLEEVLSQACQRKRDTVTCEFNEKVFKTLLKWARKLVRSQR